MKKIASPAAEQQVGVRASRRVAPRSLTIRDASDSSPASAAKIQLPLPYKYNLTFVIARGRYTLLNAPDVPGENAVEDCRVLFWTPKARKREALLYPRYPSGFHVLTCSLSPSEEKGNASRTNFRGRKGITILSRTLRNSMRFYVTPCAHKKRINLNKME